MIGCRSTAVKISVAVVSVAASLLSLSLTSVTAEAGDYTSGGQRMAIRIDIDQPVLKLFVDGKLDHTYPVALGRVETQTPIGSWRIVDKQTNWGGGFGTRWLGLDVPWGTYGIHGTNRPSSIGKYVSNGCIRMFNSDVEQLYRVVPVGTPVIVTGDRLNHLRSLEFGDIGADVQLVQQRLQRFGYFRGACNGKFTSSMQFALIYFELSRGIPMDGQVGVDDYRALGLLEKNRNSFSNSAG